MMVRGSKTLRSLTRRQRHVAVLVAAGCRNAEIARRLQISEQTVKNHLKAIFQSLGVTSRVQLAAYVHRQHPERGRGST
jgi:DNA-binding NarL/FixJ family response regulator